MRSIFTTRLALLGLSVLAAAAAGCGRNQCEAIMTADAPRSGSNTGASSGGTVTPSTSGDANRAIAEADVVQLDHEQNWIYAMSKLGSVAIVDASKPHALALLGKTALSGSPFEMYRRGSILLTMSNRGLAQDGQVVPPVTLDDGSGAGGSGAKAAPSLPPEATSGALISAVDVSDPAHMKTVATFKVPGEIADSRIVGNVLYVATYENAQCWGCATTPRTLVTSFDISDAASPKQIDQIGYLTAGVGATSEWSTPWKRSVIATDERLYVGGAGSVYASGDQGVIEVLDITDPSGKLGVGAKISTPGPIMSRWQMDESDGVLRVITQHGAGTTRNGDAYPEIDTFRIESTRSFVHLGHSTMSLPRMEKLKTVRFDKSRGYAITFNQGDPLFTLDFTDPAAPAQKGELHIPGWVFHIEPKGDRLLGLGLDRNDRMGVLNMSLFDVSDMTAPRMLRRVSFGPQKAYSDQSITDTIIAEDQSRIQKAFRIFQDGLIAVPYALGNGGTTTGPTASPTSGGLCSTGTGQIQLFEWTPESLVASGTITVAGNARRAIRRDSDRTKEIIAVSDTNVTAFSIQSSLSPAQTADVTISTCIAPQATPVPNGMPTGGDYYGGGFEGGYWGSCE